MKANESRTLLARIADQKILSRGGISTKIKAGKRVIVAKRLLRKTNIYSSIFCKLFLLKRSLADCEKALSREKISHIIVVFHSPQQHFPMFVF